MDIGVDEAGRGPILGPLVVASAAFDDDGRLIGLGVKDSKDLHPRKRVAIHDELVKMCPHATLVVPAHVVDEARSKMTLNILEVLCFSSVIASLLEGRSILHDRIPDGCTISTREGAPGPERILLDAADVDEFRFGESVRSALSELGFYPSCSWVPEHRADGSYPVVGAASIIAKVTRDREIARLEEEAGEPIGSGYPSDRRTMEFLRRYYQANGCLPPYARSTWKTCRGILGQQSSLFDF